LSEILVGDLSMPVLASLLMYQILVAQIWLLPLNVWLLLVAEQVSGGISFRRLVFSTFVVQVLQTFSMALFHNVMQVRGPKYSVIVQVLRCLRWPVLVLHAAHGMLGYVLATYVLKMSPDGTTGAVAGCTFSLSFCLFSRNVLLFPKLDSRRLSRFRSGLLIAFTRSLTSGFFIAMISNHGSSIWYKKILARRTIEAFFVHFIFDAATVLYQIVLTERKRTSMCSPSSLSCRQETQLLVELIGGQDGSLIMEALSSFSVSKCFKSSRLMEFAKAQEFRSIRDHPHFVPEYGLTEKARDSLSQWWKSTQAFYSSRFPGLSTQWERVSCLRKQRMDNVIQGVYTADAYSQGYAFREAKSVSPTQSVVGMRALLDLAHLSYFSEERRRCIYNEYWVDVWDNCTNCIDALTIALSVATSNIARRPTLPVSTTTSAFVLTPTPDIGLSADDTLKLACQSEQVAKRLRYTSWTSMSWWKNLVLAQWKDFDPLALQFSLETANVSAEHQLGKMSWEQQWERQQKARSSRLVKIVKSAASRTPGQCCASLFADSQSVVFSAIALGNLIKHSFEEDQEKRHVFTYIPVTLNCLLGCLAAIDAYIESPSFHCSLDPPLELEGNILSRPQVAEVKFAIERAVYAVTCSSGSHIHTFPIEPELKPLLNVFIAFEK